MSRKWFPCCRCILENDDCILCIRTISHTTVLHLIVRFNKVEIHNHCHDFQIHSDYKCFSKIYGSKNCFKNCSNSIRQYTVWLSHTLQLNFRQMQWRVARGWIWTFLLPPINSYISYVFWIIIKILWDWLRKYHYNNCLQKVSRLKSLFSRQEWRMNETFIFFKNTETCIFLMSKDAPSYY